MNDRLKCCIVNDLLPCYIEKLTSAETTGMIENHLKFCEKCKKQYSLMQEGDNRKSVNENNDENIEYNHLKKYNRKMLWLKIIIFSIIAIIIILSTIIGVNYLYKKYILNRIYDNYEKLRELDNYAITKEVLDVNYNTNERDTYIKKYYYKEGNMKREVRELIDGQGFKKDISSYSKMNISPNDISEYSNLKDKKSITIYETRKEYTKSELMFHTKKGELFNIQFDVDTLKMGFFPFIVKIENEEYKEKEYYILQYQYNKDSAYKQIWINKDNLNIERVIEENENYYREEVYTITIDGVMESDVIIPNLKQYKEVLIK